jgi:uncharacterized SAM-binding protein YcdF (DUF218 family)
MTYTEPLLLLCAAVAIAALWQLSPSKAQKTALCALFILVLLSMPALDLVFALPLTARYPIRPFQPPSGLQAIVVLASDVLPPEYERPYSLPDTDTFRRCEHAAWIYRQSGSLPVLACEGVRRGAKTPSVMRELLRRSGVPEDKVWLEVRSRSTHENALYGAAILRQNGIRRIVLVVDAQSMPRASACFRKEGFEVTPAPTELRTLGPWNEELIPNWRALRRNEITLHELLGLAWYRLRGWI